MGERLWNYDLDYSTKIKEAEDAGQYDLAAEYEKIRNQKIDDLGLSAKKTNTYAYDTPVTTVGDTNYYKNGTGYEGYDDGDLINYVTTKPSQLEREAASGGSGALSGGGGGGGGSLGGFGGFGGASPLWASKYQGQIDALTKSLLNREAFSYNPQSDPLYQNYLDQYTRAGSQAMQDTLGQVSARTGGLASSYATGAAQGAYNNYMQQAADKVPDLYKLAYSMYQDKGDTMMNNLGMLQGLDNTQYGRYQDNRDFNYGVSSDEWNRNFEQQQYADQLSQLALENQRYDDETAYNREQDALAASRKSSGGGGSSGSGNNSNSTIGIVNTMLSMGSEQDAAEYLMSLNLSQWEFDTLMGYYQDAVSGVESSGGSIGALDSGVNFPSSGRSAQTGMAGFGSKAEKDIAAQIDLIDKGFPFANESVRVSKIVSVVEKAYQAGEITEAQARNILAYYDIEV